MDVLICLEGGDACIFLMNVRLLHLHLLLLLLLLLPATPVHLIDSQYTFLSILQAFLLPYHHYHNHHPR